MNTTPAQRGARQEEVTVVIPCLNSEGVLDTQLLALANQTYQGPWEIVVADNGSSDGSIQVLHDWMARLPRLRLVDASDRRGASHARNVGIEAAAGDIILLCDADDVVDRGWVQAMATALMSECELAGGSLVEGLAAERTIGNPDPARTGLADWFGFLCYSATANCGFRAEVFRELGGFDETYPIGEDAEFFWRAQLASHQLSWVPEAVVYHRQRETNRAMARQFFAYGKSHAHLYRDFHTHGMPQSPTAEAIRAWWVLARSSPSALRRDSVRRDWVRQCAERLGRLVGSVHYRVVYL